jgi:hypothetical protein
MDPSFRSELELAESPHELAKGYNIKAAYLCWYSLGYLGVHNFYLKRFTFGIINAFLFTIGFITIPVKIGVIPLAVLVILLIVDFVRMPGIVKTKNLKILELQ